MEKYDWMDQRMWEMEKMANNSGVKARAVQWYLSSFSDRFENHFDKWDAAIHKFPDVDLSIDCPTEPEFIKYDWMEDRRKEHQALTGNCAIDSREFKMPTRYLYNNDLMEWRCEGYAKRFIRHLDRGEWGE